MLNLGVVVLSLESDDDHHHIDTSMRSVRNRSEERDKQLVQSWNTLLLIHSRGELRVFKGAQLEQKVDLIERNFSGGSVLDALYTTVGERTTLDRQLSELLLKDL